MTVAQLVEALAKLPADAVVLMESDGGLSLVSHWIRHGAGAGRSGGGDAAEHGG